MRIAHIFIFTLLFSPSFSQVEIKGYSELSQSLHTALFTETNFGAGITIKTSRGNISPFILYQYGGNYGRGIPAYTMNYHCLGGGLKYRFRNNLKIYSTTIQASAYTEVASTYRGKYLSTFLGNYSFNPSNDYATEWGGKISQPYYHYVYYYVSTPLIGNILIGHEFRLTEGLYFNLGLGYSARAVKVRYKSWSINSEESESDISNTHGLKDVKWIHLVDLNVGLNYVFPVKKKE